MSQHEILLDVSHLEPPEPLQKALEAIENLRQGEHLRMLHRRKPELLYPMLQKRGFSFHTFKGKQVAYEILIWKDGDAEAEARCQSLVKQSWDNKKARAAANDIPKLSFEQAPPISVPLRFFLSAPVFGFLAALILMIAGPEALTSRWTPEVLAATHFIMLGFATMVMMGASLQILPVVIGTVIARSRLISTLIYLLYIPGVIALGSAFLFRKKILFEAAATLLGMAFTIFISVVLYTLLTTPVKTSTSRAVQLAVFSLGITVLIGVLMAAVYGAHGGLTTHTMTLLHLGWGFIGWAGLLIIGVSFQVVPMFQITPHYPVWLKRWMPASITGLLIIWSFMTYFFQQKTGTNFVSMVSGVTLLALVFLYAIQTLRMQQKRRRKIADVTVRFWQIAMLSVLVSIILVMLKIFWPDIGRSYYIDLVIGILIVMGIIQSVINGMLYKIVPFLVWLHLQAKQIPAARLPNMKEVISDKKMVTQYWLHCVSVPLLVSAVVYPETLAYPALAVYAGSMLLLWVNLLGGVRLYYTTLQQTT